jgi:DNA-binding response OmpR family regulator
MRVLIVDDDAGLRQSLALQLQEAGYDVVRGRSRAGLQRAAAGPSTSILRRRMPKMDGVTFLRRYRPTAAGAAHH